MRNVGLRSLLVCTAKGDAFGATVALRLLSRAKAELRCV